MLIYAVGFSARNRNPCLQLIPKKNIPSYLLNSEESINIVNHYENESVYNYDNMKSIRQLTNIYGKIKPKDKSPTQSL